MMKIPTAIAFFAIFACCAAAHAVVTFDWATVGDPNNPPDQLYTFNNPTNLQFGSVANTYRISKYEVTNAQYTEFLNAVDPMGTNPNSIYRSLMASEPRGGIDFNAASRQRLEILDQDQHGQQACELCVLL